MSRSAHIVLPFADDDYPFRLGIKQLRELQEKCGERGPMTILNALTLGSWLVDDVVQTIRLGLIGAGMKEEAAAKLVRDRVEDGRYGECIFLAQAIIQAAIVGPKEDPIDKPKGQAPPGESKGATAGSASPSSTETGPSSDSLPARSMN